MAVSPCVNAHYPHMSPLGSLPPEHGVPRRSPRVPRGACTARAAGGSGAARPPCEPGELLGARAWWGSFGVIPHCCPGASFCPSCRQPCRGLLWGLRAAPSQLGPLLLYGFGLGFFCIKLQVLQSWVICQRSPRGSSRCVAGSSRPALTDRPAGTRLLLHPVAFPTLPYASPHSRRSLQLQTRFLGSRRASGNGGMQGSKREL